MRLLLCAVVLLLCAPERAEAQSRLNTYLEGRIIAHKGRHVVLVTEEGTYWINTAVRPLNFTRELDMGRIGFWIQVVQIERFRATVPVMNEQIPASRIADRRRRHDGPG